jgi:enoyl-CoA hydratase/carnithine racemase
MVGATRVGGEDAARARIVDAAVPEDEVLAKSVELAATHAAKLGSTLGTIKQRMYAHEFTLLMDPEANPLFTAA